MFESSHLKSHQVLTQDLCTIHELYIFSLLALFPLLGSHTIISNRWGSGIYGGIMGVTVVPIFGCLITSHSYTYQGVLHSV